MSRKGENIYKRKDGRWEGRLAIEILGKKHYKSVYGRSYKEVKNKMMAFMQKPNCPTIGKIDFKSASEEWINQAKPRVKESTIKNYTYLLKKHILPFFGNINMADISRDMINSFIQEKLTNGMLKQERGISKKYLRDILSIVKAIAAYCEQEYDIQDKIRRVQAPKPEKKETKVLDDEDYNRLREYLINDKTPENLAIIISMYTGLRIGEVCGLKWMDFNYNEKTLTIRRTIQRISDGNNSTFLLISSPKTEASVRTIPVPDFLCNIINTYRKDSNVPIVSTGDNYSEPYIIRKNFKTILELCGIAEIRFHDLRHSFASRCIRLNFDVKSLSEILGHSDVALTLNRYVHSSMKIKRMLMERLVE